LRACIGVLLTRVAPWFVEESRERFGFCGAFALGRVRPTGHLGCSTGMVGPPDMHEEADQRESDEEELVKQEVGCHDDVSFHDVEKRRLYRICSLPNYPLSTGTGPPGHAFSIRS
jgi:hypothetical protein